MRACENVEPGGEVLNLGAWLPSSTANGPGRRFVIWLQGCPLRCSGCFNPEFQPFTPNHVITVEDMLTRILDSPGIEGVTYTGGEPMAQAMALLALSRQLCAYGLSIVSYTGYTYEDLLRSGDPFILALLDCLDILIDGPYQQEEHKPLLWRGSANQRVVFLSERYKSWADAVNQPTADIEFFVGERLTVTGIWEEQFLHRVLANLAGNRESDSDRGSPCSHERL